MAKKTVKRIKFNTTHFNSGLPQYEAGKHYPPTEETLRLVKYGIAEEVEIDETAAEQTDLALASEEAKTKPGAGA